MLIVFARPPVASPFEACFKKQADTEVVADYFVWEVLRAVAVFLGVGRLNVACAVGADFIIGIVKRIDIYRQSLGMLREFFAATDFSVAEAGGVVGTHLLLIVGIINVWQHHALDRVLGFVEFA